MSTNQNYTYICIIGAASLITSVAAIIAAIVVTHKPVIHHIDVTVCQSTPNSDPTNLTISKCSNNKCSNLDGSVDMIRERSNHTLDTYYV